MTPTDETTADHCSGDHMTTAEVATFARTCVETVRRHRRAGLLKPCGGIRKLVFDRAEVERWFRAGGCAGTVVARDNRAAFVRAQLGGAWAKIELDRRTKARRSS